MIFKTPSNLSSFFSNLKDGTAFQIRFKDRVGAGIALSTALKFAIKRKKKSGEKILVLGIPRGGVIVADVVAQKMNAEFGVVMAKKLSAPDNKENAIGAVVHDGYVYLDDFMVTSLRVPAEYIEKEKELQLLEIQSGNQPIQTCTKRISNSPACIVILVDDGIATGSTLIANYRWIRKQKPSQLVIATPVAQPQARV